MSEDKIKVGFANLPTPIVEHLQESITSRLIRPHVYHVTELIYCLKKAWYHRMYPERSTFSTKSLWNIYRGNLFDRKFTSLFKIHQKNCRVKKDGLTITGTSDFVYNNGDDLVLYDLKMPASTYFKKTSGAGEIYCRQVQAYLALNHELGQLLDVHRARVLMIAGDVVVEEVDECPGMLDDYLWPRAQALDAALAAGSPVKLSGPEERWECGSSSEGVSFCPADQFFRELC